MIINKRHMNKSPPPDLTYFKPNESKIKTTKQTTMKKFNVLLVILIAVSVIFVNCNKETAAPPPSKETATARKGAVPQELTGPDVNCGGQEIQPDAALRQIVFTADLPNSVFYNFNLATPSDVVIFMQD